MAAADVTVAPGKPNLFEPFGFPIRSLDRSLF